MSEEVPGSTHSGSLLRASRMGDRAALEALLQQQLPALRAFVRLRMSPLLRAREAEEDLVQSACCDILLALDDFEYRGEEAFRGWLFTAVWNKLLNHERAARSQRRDARREIALDGQRTTGGSARSLGAVYARALTPTQVAMAGERIERLEAAFDRLPDHYREVVTLSRIAQLPRAEVAARMGRSEDSVRNLLHRALVELALLLQGATGRPRQP
ncbi:MAG: sigma-70 family RNA polymerase sigma factor [Planctomycetes bacterium]|nr:sigma-70 family RNA polymerase sigma factor [Planctomycetota bacterium]